MRIALIGARCYPPRHGGLEVVVSELAGAFAELGNEVHLYASEVDRDYTYRGFQVHEVAALKGKYTTTLSQVIASSRGVRELTPDVVSIHGVGPSIPLALNRNFFGRSPTVVTCHGADWRRDKWPLPAKYAFKKVAGAAIARSSAVTAVSRLCASQIARDVGISSTPIGNGVSIPLAVESDVTRDLPSVYSVAVSRLTPEKRVELLVEAYDSTVARRLGPLIVIGSGTSSHTSSYAQKVRAVASRDTLFLGHLEHDDTLAIVKNATRYFSLSRFEAQPLSVLEAMALGVPVHVSDIDAHRELCEDGASYISSESVAGVRNYLLRNDLAALESEAVVRARNIAGGRRWSQIASDYINIFEAAARYENTNAR